MRHTIRAAALAAALGVVLAAPAGARPMRMPAYTRTQLPNGLVVFVMPMQRLPVVDFRLVARAGSVTDPAGKEGLASLTASLLDQGAGKRNAKQIAEDIAFVGGSLGAGAGTEQLVVTCGVLKKDFATGLELFRDVIVQPTFPAEEFQRKKQETLGDIASQRSDPQSIASNMVLPFMLGSSPLAHPPLGWQQSVESLTRDDVAAFYRAQMTPDNAMLAIVGDVDAKATLAAVQKAFAAWKPSGAQHPELYGPLPREGARKVLIVEKPEVTQTQIRFICPGVPRKNPDDDALRVANTILGAGFTSRLVNDIRVTQGLTYSISSRFNSYRNAGTFGVSTFTRNETLRKTIDETLKTIRGLVEQGPTQAELDKAKRYITGQFPLGLQASSSLASQLLDIEFFGLDPKYVDTFADRTNAVTMADVKRVLKEHVCVDDLRILVVSNPTLAKKALNGLGPIEVTAVR